MSSQAIRDRRQQPFFPVTKGDLVALAEACEVSELNVRLSSVRSVYFALLELANDDRSDSTEVTRKGLGERAGVSPRTVFDTVEVIVSAGLLEVEKNEGYTDIWTLTSARTPRQPLPHPPATIAAPPRQPLPGSIETGQEEKKEDTVASATSRLWERYVAMRARSPKKLRRTELDAQTKRMIEKALTVGSEEEWLLAIDALLHSKHNIGKNDRRTVYVEPRHIFTACTHGTTRQHLDYLLDISQTAHLGSGGNATTSALDAKIREAKRNVLTAFDLAGSGEAQRSGDESERFLAQHGWRVERAADGRPSFVSPPSSS